MTKILTKYGGAIAGLACAAVLAMAVTPALAASPTTYSTTITQVQPGPTAGEYDGKLQLSISPDGIISGYYIPEYDGSFVPVTGGEQNGSYWLDIAGSTDLHIYGRVDTDGSLVGTATTMPDTNLDGTAPFTSTFSFVAKPQAASSY
ncbi:MAG TPA: hypothetical protein VKT51_05600 [Candidatus Eremiobacteraceae bacterium]|nr:hypothetical protein [Candidatus Eremiobacteraceae bacterium]